MGSMHAPLDLTYLADTVLLTRYFEAFGTIKKAISVIKKRTGAHEETLREYRIAKGGIQVGKILRDFKGVFTGVPTFTGDLNEILKSESVEHK
jgi:circadian clock protein KaiC